MMVATLCAIALATSSAAHKAGDIVIQPATARLSETENVPYELGTMYVPENRSDPKTRLIAVGFARFKATKPAGAPPIFYLPGGPGQSYVADVKKGVNLKHMLRYSEAADVIAVDQRGYSDQGDYLRYTYMTREEPLDQPASIKRSTEKSLKAARDAVEYYTKKGFDLRGYSVKDLAEDVNDLRKALGFEKISLVGISFGSQWSFAIMRLHPEMISRVMLSGAEPLNNGYDMPSGILGSMRHYWKVAEQDQALAPYVPAGGINSAARAVFKRFDSGAIKVRVKDPKDGQMVTVVLGKEDLQRDFKQLAAPGPAFVLSLYYEHYEAWAQSVLAERRSHQFVWRIIGPLIDTSLGVTPERLKQLNSDPACEFLGKWNWTSYIASAGIWPTPDVGDDFRNPVQTPIPIILMHGDWDTSTPLENSLGIIKFFPKGRLLIVEHGEHMAREQVARNSPTEWGQMMDFLRTGNMPDLPDRIVLPVPKFAVPDFPPPAKQQKGEGK